LYTVLEAMLYSLVTLSSIQCKPKLLIPQLLLQKIA